jgi:hypothetical protein
VSAIRPANTDTTGGRVDSQRVGDASHLRGGEDGRDVNLHALQRQFPDQGERAFSRVLVIGILT